MCLLRKCVKCVSEELLLHLRKLCLCLANICREDICVCVHMCVCADVYVHMCVCADVCAHMHVRVCLLACMHTCVHVQAGWNETRILSIILIFFHIGRTGNSRKQGNNWYHCCFAWTQTIHQLQHPTSCIHTSRGWCH
jgi:hypothetical protein